MTGHGGKIAAFAAALAAAAGPLSLAAWSLVFAWLLMEGRYQAFLQPRLGPLVAAGSALAAAMALASLLSLLREGLLQSSPRGGVAGAVLLLLPIAVLVPVYGESLGRHALSKRAFIGGIPASGAAAAAAAAPAARQDFAESGPAREATLLDLTERPGEFAGLGVVVEGMVSKAGGMPEGWILLFRFRIVCCAADAQPLGVMVRGSGFETLREDSWARVEGRFETLDFEGEAVLAVTASKAVEIPVPPPEKRYLFK